MKGRRLPVKNLALPRPAARRGSDDYGEPGPNDPEEPEGARESEDPLEGAKEMDGVSGEKGEIGESEKRILELLERHQEDGPPPRPRRKRARPDKFRLLDHTADIGLQAFGETMGEAFENAALGMFYIMTDPSKVGMQQDFEVTIEGEDLKGLLHEWLGQLLVLAQLNNMLFSGFKVDLKRLDDRLGLTGLAMGEPADPSRHVYKTEIKAVTHHMLEVREDPPMVKVLFDI